ncbi:MAG: hypothetical protein V4655_14580 [Bdellovibrionota bacterium]|nr:MAG: hypothetical protein EOP10_24420 [Pseudomonadota bacterium]
MDVLQLLKAEFRERKSELSALEKPETSDAAKKKILGALNAHLAWESEYLLPELSHIASRGDVLFDKYQQSLSELNTMSRKKGQDDLDLLKAFNSHTFIVEEKILPYMRQKIPTIDREELYHVFADAKQELIATRSASFASH